MEKRLRSPNYPALSLPDAIERAATLYRAQHSHAAPREIVAKGMGYNSLNGASASAISALYKYGLLDRLGDEIKVSDRAMRILHPHSPEERGKAIQEAAYEPPLFAELRDRFPGQMPSDDLLRNYLIRNGFAPSALTSVMLAYRKTSEMAESEGQAHDSPREQTRERTDMSELQNRLREPPPPAASAPVIGLLADGRIVINTTLNDKESVDDLIAKLNALRVIAPDRPKMTAEEKVAEFFEKVQEHPGSEASEDQLSTTLHPRLVRGASLSSESE